MGSASSVRVLLARTSRRSRGWLATTIALGCAGRLLFVGIAYLFALAGSRRESVQLALLSAGLFAALRAVQSLARTSVQRDVYAMTSRAVLASDVLAVPTRDVRGVALDGTYHAVQLVADLTPAFLADIAASLAIFPLVVMTFEPRLLVIAGLAMVVVTAVAAFLRAMARRIEERSVKAYAAVIEKLLGSIDGRLEIVSRAGEAETALAFEQQLDAFEKVSRRSAFGRAFLGRAPLVAGALAVALVVALDEASRSALEGALLTKAVLLAASVPALHGAVLGLHGMVRSLVFVRPLVDLLSVRSPHAAGGVRVDLPAVVSGRNVSFEYAADGVPTFSNVSFEWQPGEPLVITGPNGAGKSTLLKLLLGLRPPTSGTLTIGGHALSTIDLPHLRRQTAYLPQRPYLGEAYGTVRAALELSAPRASDAEMRSALSRTRVLDMLHEHGADELACPVGELSAGQRQRVALARLLLQNARMVLLDEPDANLDASGIDLVAMLVRELSAQGTMVAIAAHTPELAALAPSRLELSARAASDQEG